MTTCSFDDNRSGAATAATVISPVFDGQRNTRGRFVPGSNGNPKGRPRGACNKATLMARLLLDEKVTELAQKVIGEALQGDKTALKLCFERLAPKPKDAPIEFDLPAPTGSPTDLVAAHNALIRSMAAGEITPKEGEAVSKVLEARRRSWETVEFAKRLEEIERRLNIQPMDATSSAQPESNGTYHY